MQRGFKVTTILIDGKFECLRGDLAIIHIHLSTCVVNAHVGEGGD